MSFLSSLFGYKDKPATGTKVSYIPPELKPYVEEVLKDSQALYKERLGQGYIPYTGETIAGFSPEQLQSQEGLKSLVGSQRPLLDESLRTVRGGQERFTADTAKEYMSPYMRAVIDQEKEQAQRQYERTKRPEFEAEAVRAGGMSGLGTRAAVESAERETGQQRLLAGIEAKGLQKAYEDAQKQFESQKQRERLMASDLAQTGQNIFSAGLAEQGLLQDIGEKKQAMQQQALDEAYYKWKQQQQFPEEQLARYTTSIYGNPVLSQPTYTTTETPAQASMGKSLLGLGLAGYRAGGGFTPGGFSFGNLFGGGKKAGGGQVGGLTTLYRQAGSQVGMPRYSITGDELYTEENVPEFIEGGSGDPTSRDENLMRVLSRVDERKTSLAPKPEPKPTADKPRRKTVAELAAQIRGTPQDAVMAGISAFLEPFGTPADMPGAMAKADRKAAIDTAKEELKIAAEEQKAQAIVDKARIKAFNKLKEYKHSDVRAEFKDQFNILLGGITIADDGSILSIENEVLPQNPKEAAKMTAAISEIRKTAMGMRENRKTFGQVSKFIRDALKNAKQKYSKRKK
tara:strand:+ start:991 stop:2700 length:1710 start_codon:yes stop_codon:yes gene_type:complete